MKLLQVLYPGLGGTSTVAFSIVNDLKKMLDLMLKIILFFME